MKILMVTTGYPRDEADMSGIFIKRLAKALTRQGAQVTVLAPGDRHAWGEEIDQAIRIIRFPYAPRSWMTLAYGAGGIPENLRFRPKRILLLPFFIGSLLWQTARLAGDYDLIHAQWLFTGIALLPVRFLRRKPLVVTLRGSDFRGRASGILIGILRRMNAVTTVNRHWAETLRPALGGKVFFTPNGLDIPGPAPCGSTERRPSPAVTVLYVGALTPTKGIDLLARSARRLQTVAPSIRFLVVGPGDPRPYGLDRLSNVTCLGSQPPDEMSGVYRAGDIFVLPSRHEGRPNALLEAMASGLPSVATGLPGIIEVLTADCGMIVPVDDESALTEAILLLARDPERRRILGGRAAARVANLSLDWDSCARGYLSIFEKLSRSSG